MNFIYGNRIERVDTQRHILYFVVNRVEWWEKYFTIVKVFLLLLQGYTKNNKLEVDPN